MLITGRRVGDEVFIGDDIRIIIAQVEGGTAKLAIEAPLDVKIRVPAIERKKKRLAAGAYEF